MRFYARHPHPKFGSHVDKLNWTACDRAIKHFSDDEREILLTVYREADTIADNIFMVATKRRINQDSIWKLLGDLEHKVAKARDLI